MPFADNPVRGFTRANVEALTPGQLGVYGLFREGHWIYVGSGDVRARLLDHLNGDNACITREAPTSWIDEVRSDYKDREKELILELAPPCNKKVG